MKALVTKPRWLLLHLVVLAVAVVMLRLGSWQLDQAADSGRVQNYAYALQWLLFAAFTVVAYAKLARDEVRPPAEDDAPELVLPVREQPTAPVDDAGDDELAAYNAYLASLAERRP